MAKKSTGTKHASTPRRPTTTSGGAPKRPAIDQGRVTLVRTPSTSTATVTDDAPKAPAAVEATPALKQPEVSAAPKAVARPATSAPAKPAAARPAATTAARPTAPRVPPRAARMQARARANPLVTPEHYAYVRNDLIRTAVLAATMFIIIVIAYFILHAHGMA